MKEMDMHRPLRTDHVSDASMHSSTPARAMSRRSFLAKSAAVAALGGLGSAAGLLDASPSEASTPFLGTVALQLGWVKNVSYAGSYIAASNGYYRKHGVDVNILSGGPTVAGIPVLVSNKAIIAISDPTTTSQAYAQGADIAIVAAGYQINPACIMSLAKTPIKTPKDLIGKKIGIASSDQAEWQAFLKINNISPSSVDTLPAGFDPSPVASGEWDGYLAFANNEPPQFEAEGLKTELLLFQDYGMPSVSDVYVVTGETLKNKAARAKAAAFLAGEIQGWTKAVADPVLGTKLTIDKYGKGLGLTYKGELLSAEATNAISVSPATKEHGLLYLSPAAIVDTARTLAKTGVHAPRALFDTSLLEEAYALI